MQMAGIERIKIREGTRTGKTVSIKSLDTIYIIGTAVSTEENRAGQNAALGALSRRRKVKT
jgi:hypothetical protein